MRRFRLAFAALAVVLAAGAGCSSDDSGSPGEQIEQTEDTVDDLNQQTDDKEQQTGDANPFDVGG